MSFTFLISGAGSVRSRALVFGIALILFVLMVSANGQEDDEEFVQEGLATNEVKTGDQDPVKLFLKGQDAHAQGDLDKALELYSKALEEFPEFPEAEYQRGTIYQAREMWKEAESSFRKAVDYRKDWTLAMAGLGAVLIQNEKYEEAGIVLEKAIRLDGMSFPAYVSLTDLYLARDPSEAKIKGLYSGLVFLTTKSNTPASIWACRGAIERILKKKDDAKSSIFRALEIDPQNRLARVEQIELALENSDFEAASELSAILVKQNPGNIGLTLLQARSVALGGDVARAVEIIESLPDPGDEGRKLLTAIKTDGAVDLAELEGSLSKNKDDVAILGRLCSALRVEEPQKALEYCERAFRLEPDNIGHAIGFGAALVQLRQFERAIGLLEEIKIRVPDNHTVRANLATAYFKNGEFEKAKNEYIWITTAQPDLAAGYFFLAIAHDNLREYVDAMANYQQFIRLADKKRFEGELDRVRLRLPLLQKQIEKGRGNK